MCSYYCNNLYHNSNQNFPRQWKIRVSKNSDAFQKFVLSFFPVKLDTITVDNFLSLIIFFDMLYLYSFCLYLLSWMNSLCLKKNFFRNLSIYKNIKWFESQSLITILINSSFFSTQYNLWISLCCTQVKMSRKRNSNVLLNCMWLGLWINWI